MNQTQHELYDKAFFEAGFQISRSNCYFIVGDINIARSYSHNRSDIYVVFPFNGFQYTWSPLVNDLLGSRLSKKTWQLYKNEGRSKDMKGNLLGEDYHSYIVKYIKKYYQDDEIENALGTENEIMIGGQYIAVDLMYRDEISKKLGFSIR